MLSIEKNGILKPLKILRILKHFFTLGKAPLLPLYLQILKFKQMSNEYRKSVATKKSIIFKKLVWSFKTLNSKFFAK